MGRKEKAIAVAIVISFAICILVMLCTLTAVGTINLEKGNLDRRDERKYEKMQLAGGLGLVLVASAIVYMTGKYIIIFAKRREL